MRKRVGIEVPADLLAAVDIYARAIVAGQTQTAVELMDPRGAEAHREALSRLAEIAPLGTFEPIARARIGLEYIVKLRFHGASGRHATLQLRWHRFPDGRWRIVELNDLGIHSPWKKPDKPEMVNFNA